VEKIFYRQDAKFAKKNKKNKEKKQSECVKIKEMVIFCGRKS